MIWLAWRQFRSQAVIVFGALAALAVLVVVTGLQARHWFADNGLASCAATGSCGGMLAEPDQLLQVILGRILMLAVPGVLAVFWAAPLIARETETGTHRLAWTQSITRARWLAAKITVVGVASVAVSGLLSWLVTWWFTPFDAIAGDTFDGTVFSERDVVPLGYAAFGFALGLVCGLLIRKTLPAMATTLVGYVAARIIVMQWIRPHLATPLVSGAPLAPGTSSDTVRLAGGGRGGWLLSARIVNSAGQPVRPVPGDSLAGYRQIVSYQPASRFWPFQWYETGLFVGVALVLVGFCFWWITGHRLPAALPLGSSRRGRRSRQYPRATRSHQYVTVTY